MPRCRPTTPLRDAPRSTSRHSRSDTLDTNGRSSRAVRRAHSSRHPLVAVALVCACHHPPRAITVTPLAAQTSQALPSPPVESVHRSAIELRRAEVTARAITLIDEAMRTHPGCGAPIRERLHDSFARCEEAPGGAWATLVSSIDAPTANDSDDFCYITGEWRVAFVTLDGRMIEAPSDARGPILPPQRFDVGSEGSTDGTTVLPSATSDIDGDGRAEVFVRVSQTDSSGGGARTQTLRQGVLTARGDTLSEYAPASGLEIVEAEDLDGNGRLDFIIESPYQWSSPTNCSPPREAFFEHRLFHLAAHAQPDGTYSTTDAVAQEYARRVCPTPDGEPSADRPDHIADTEEYGELRIACRRLWGQSPARALRGFQCQRFALPGDPECSDPAYRYSRLPRGTCPTFFESWAHMAPPLTLR